MTFHSNTSLHSLTLLVIYYLNYFFPYVCLHTHTTRFAFIRLLLQPEQLPLHPGLSSRNTTQHNLRDGDLQRPPRRA